MLKETETEETRLFLLHFIIGGISLMGEGRAPPAYAHGQYNLDRRFEFRKSPFKRHNLMMLCFTGGKFLLKHTQYMGLAFLP